MASISPIHASDGSPRYVVNYRDPEDRQRRKSFRKKADAKAFRNIVEADKLRGTYLDVNAGRVTFRDYAAEWLANRTFDRTTHEATDLRLRVHVLPVIGHLQLRSDQAVDHSRIAPDDGPVGHLPPRDPGQRLGDPRRRGRRRPDREEPVQGWIRHATVRSSPQGRAVASRAGQCHARRPPRALPAGCHARFGLGLRQGEIFGLSPTDFNFLAGTVEVQRQVRILAGNKLVFAPPKGRKTRTVHSPRASRRRSTLTWHSSRRRA